MSLFRIWAKSGVTKTIESLGVSLSESRVIVGSVHTALFDEMRRLSKKLNNQQRNILLAKYCLIFHQEKYNNYVKAYDIAIEEIGEISNITEFGLISNLLEKKVLLNSKNNYDKNQLVKGQEMLAKYTNN